MMCYSLEQFFEVYTVRFERIRDCVSKG